MHFCSEFLLMTQDITVELRNRLCEVGLPNRPSYKYAFLASMVGLKLKSVKAVGRMHALFILTHRSAALDAFTHALEDISSLSPENTMLRLFLCVSTKSVINGFLNFSVKSHLVLA